ncbi:MAG: L-aspartate oxidase [Candidatus Kapaibacterium sp.]
MYETEILVAGTGLAGAMAAITAADLGRKVTIVTKSDKLLSGNTPYAQGGIIYKGLKDTPEKMKYDIMTAGDGHCWEPAVDKLTEDGPRLVRKYLIERFGVDFDRTGGGQLDLIAEGAHSEPRIIHSKDQTGRSIQKAVLDELEKHPNIEILTGHTLIDLLTFSHNSKNTLDIYKKPTCFGAFVLDNDSGEISPIYAIHTILATGGLGQIFLHTTNRPGATGDGIATAWRAGARCFNLHYIQFHPTTFYNHGERFLISEAVRGEGGVLIDHNGRQFMKDFHELGSLAPRDIVARGIHQTLLDSGRSCVYLDISFKDTELIKSRFPNIYKHCLEHNIDMAREPIPVVPAAHYSCGGVGVNLNGRTSLQRLYAVGEVACTGVHGANRLASTSLLESLVWGYAAGKDSAEKCEDCHYFPDIYPWQEEQENVDPAHIAQDWLTIKNTMWNYVGLMRTRQRLYRAQTTLRHLQTEIEQFYRRAKMSRGMIQLRNGVQTAIAVVNAAQESRVSQGAHYMEED